MPSFEEFTFMINEGGIACKNICDRWWMDKKEGRGHNDCPYMKRLCIYYIHVDLNRNYSFHIEVQTNFNTR
jgi:hypothetical protein